MRNFVAIGKKQGLRILFKYDLNGVLRNVEFDGKWTDQLVSRVKHNLPENLQMAITFSRNDNPKNPFYFKEITELSFEIFYKRWPNKLGKKKEAQKAWEKMTAAEQMDAMLYLDEYIPKKHKENTNFPYASSYLNGKYWE